VGVEIFLKPQMHADKRGYSETSRESLSVQALGIVPLPLCLAGHFVQKLRLLAVRIEQTSASWLEI
jgi:hypothetical protein